MVFPSSFEGFGMPPMEALLHGIPCICSDLPILREVYENHVIYFKEHDIKDLAIKIEYFLENIGSLSKITEPGKQYVLNKYGWDKSAQSLIDYIENRKE